jgi:hypothetical protein
MQLYITTMRGQILCVSSRDAYAIEVRNSVGREVAEVSVHTVDSNSDFAYIVTVGEGDKTRIVDVFSERGVAAKVASSLNARLRKFEVITDDVSSERLRFYKYFVHLEGGREVEEYCEDCDSYNCGCIEEFETVYYVDSFSRFYRKSDLAEFNTPIITHRRRYSNSLPHRFEVAAPDQPTAREVARWWEYARLNYPELEYNVDYKVVREGNRWTIEEKLLTNRES